MPGGYFPLRWEVSPQLAGPVHTGCFASGPSGFPDLSLQVRWSPTPTPGPCFPVSRRLEAVLEASARPWLGDGVLLETEAGPLNGGRTTRLRRASGAGLEPPGVRGQRAHVSPACPRAVDRPGSVADQTEEEKEPERSTEGLGDSLHVSLHPWGRGQGVSAHRWLSLAVTQLHAFMSGFQARRSCRQSLGSCSLAESENKIT